MNSPTAGFFTCTKLHVPFFFFVGGDNAYRIPHYHTIQGRCGHVGLATTKNSAIFVCFLFLLYLQPMGLGMRRSMPFLSEIPFA